MFVLYLLNLTPIIFVVFYFSNYEKFCKEFIGGVTFFIFANGIFTRHYRS